MDRANSRDPSAHQKFQDEIATTPLPHVQEEVNDHASYLSQQVHEAGIKAFKTDKIHPRKPYLQATTFALIRAR
eukprot:6487088-Pyramimonas_sp.AAC.1